MQAVQDDLPCGNAIQSFARGGIWFSFLETPEVARWESASENQRQTGPFDLASMQGVRRVAGRGPITFRAGEWRGYCVAANQGTAAISLAPALRSGLDRTRGK